MGWLKCVFCRANYQSGLRLKRYLVAVSHYNFRRFHAPAGSVAPRSARHRIVHRENIN